MSITHPEAVASLHVLVAVAQADGTLHAEERDALEAGLREVGLDADVSAKDLFEDAFDLDEQLGMLQSEEAREEAFRSAYSLAWADGDCSPEEKRLLSELRLKLGVSAQREAELEKLFSDSTGRTKSGFTFIADVAQREKQIKSETRKCAFVCAVLGAVPFPGLAILTDLGIVALQVGLVRDIGAMCGREIDKKSAKKLLAGFGVGSGARIALSNIAKLLPGWGSLVGMTTAYASTWAVGRVLGNHLAEEAELDAGALRDEFEQAKAEGLVAYEEDKAKLAEVSASKKAELAELVGDLKEGQLDRFEEKASRL